MGKEKKNFYVVWQGLRPGIYPNWAECQKQIIGYTNAKYKGFKTQQLAEKAFKEGPENYWGKDVVESTLSKEELKRIGSPIIDSVVVDAAHSSSTNQVEYKGIYLKSGELLFQKGPYKDGTNNIGEFLAIVHALAYLKKNNSSIYPNPGNDFIHLKLNSESVVMYVNIYNSVGDLIFTNNFFHSNSISINTTELPNGIYSVQIVTENNHTENIKWIKSN